MLLSVSIGVIRARGVRMGNVYSWACGRVVGLRTKVVGVVSIKAVPSS